MKNVFVIGLMSVFLLLGCEKKADSIVPEQKEEQKQPEEQNTKEPQDKSLKGSWREILPNENATLLTFSDNDTVYLQNMHNKIVKKYTYRFFCDDSIEVERLDQLKTSPLARKTNCKVIFNPDGTVTIKNFYIRDDEIYPPEYVDVTLSSDCTFPQTLIVNIFEKGTLEIPQSYLLQDFSMGYNSVDIRSAKQDIVLGAERSIFFEYDTIFSFNNNKELLYVKDAKGTEIGVVSYYEIGGNFRNLEGDFWLKEKDYYLKLLNLSFSDKKIIVLQEILSTFKNVKK